MAKNKELSVVEQSTPESQSVESILTLAVKQGANIDTLERLLTMRRELKAEQAKNAYIQALTDFQVACPIIEKKKAVNNKDGRTVRFKYAPIDSVIEQIKKPLGKSELSYTWDVKLENNHMKVTCKLTHVMGHTESSTFEIPIVTSDYMTSPQSYATAQTYAKRYTLLNVLGIATADEDTDATDTGKEKPALSDKSKIIFLLKRLGKNTAPKEVISAEVVRLTKLDLEEKNYEEIISRLEVVVKEKESDESN